MSFTTQFLFSANLLYSSCLSLSQLSLLHVKCILVEVINYQLREFQVLGRKTKQSSPGHKAYTDKWKEPN